MVIKSTKQKDTKLCSYPMPVCDEWRTNGALNLASVIFARKHWIFNWI
jgi:hypothetical protein